MGLYTGQVQTLQLDILTLQLGSKLIPQLLGRTHRIKDNQNAMLFQLIFYKNRPIFYWEIVIIINLQCYHFQLPILD